MGRHKGSKNRNLSFDLKDNFKKDILFNKIFYEIWRAKKFLNITDKDVEQVLENVHNEVSK